MSRTVAVMLPMPTMEMAMGFGCDELMSQTVGVEDVEQMLRRFWHWDVMNCTDPGLRVASLLKLAVDEVVVDVNVADVEDAVAVEVTFVAGIFVAARDH